MYEGVGSTSSDVVVVGLACVDGSISRKTANNSDSKLGAGRR